MSQVPYPIAICQILIDHLRTCFWAGDVFAPNLVVTTAEGEQLGVQTFLQSRFLSCFENLAKELDSISSILGFECLNEPHGGYINLPSLHEFNYYTELHFHDTRTSIISSKFAQMPIYASSIRSSIVCSGCWPPG